VWATGLKAKKRTNVCIAKWKALGLSHVHGTRGANDMRRGDVLGHSLQFQRPYLNELLNGGKFNHARKSLEGNGPRPPNGQGSISNEK